MRFFAFDFSCKKVSAAVNVGIVCDSRVVDEMVKIRPIRCEFAVALIKICQVSGRQNVRGSKGNVLVNPCEDGGLGGMEVVFPLVVVAKACVFDFGIGAADANAAEDANGEHCCSRCRADIKDI